MNPIEKPALPEPQFQIVGLGFDVYKDEEMTAYADTCRAPLLARIEELEAENAALVNMGLEQQLKHTDRIEELEKDAARYRWLKLQSKPGEPFDLLTKMREAHALVEAYKIFCTGWTKWDESIDAALSATKEPS